jgi:5-methylthioadenosine/S-adenosylhomocysteine deaminase
MASNAASTRSVRRIAGVTALLGDGYEPRVVDIVLDGTRIGSIDPPDPAGVDTDDPSTTVIDGKDLLAFPGMVDCHDHLRVLAPGLSSAEGVTLDEFLKQMWSTQAQMGVAEYRIAALLGCVQRLKTGITTVADHCYTFHTPGLDEASLDGYRTSGVRWSYARGVMTRPYAPVCETWEVAEDRIRELVASKEVPPERLFVAPVSIRQATPDDFRRARGLADELGCGLYTHVAETQDERETWQRECGRSPIHALDALGFLTPHTILVHGVFLDDDEIALIAERGAHVVHCPTNNMKLGKGFTRVPDLLAAGVNVGMGVDMMADMLVEMRVEVGIHAALRHDPNAVTRSQVFRMATAGGAMALGLDSGAGVLAPGMAADIVLLDGRSVLQAPMIDPAHALLYATNAGMVRHVLVDGALVVSDGRSTMVDEEELLQEAEEIATSFLRRIDAPELPWRRT